MKNTPIKTKVINAGAKNSSKLQAHKKAVLDQAEKDLKKIEEDLKSLEENNI